MNTSGMEVTFRYRLWDSFRATLYQMPRNRATQVSVALVFLISEYNLINDQVNSAVDLSTKIITLALSTILLVLFLVVFFGVWSIAIIVITYLTKRSVRENYRREYKLVLSEDGIGSESAMGQSMSKLLAVRKIEETGRFILFHGDGGLICLIPLRAFADRMHVARFLNNAHRLWERSKRSPNMDQQKTL